MAKSNRAERLTARVTLICALAALGKAHGVSVTVRPVHQARNGAEEDIWVVFRSESDRGLYPPLPILATLDDYYEHFRDITLSISRAAWHAALAHAAAHPDTTQYACCLCRALRIGTPGPHDECLTRANRQLNEYMSRNVRPEKADGRN